MRSLRHISHHLFVEAVRPRTLADDRLAAVTSSEPYAAPDLDLPFEILQNENPLPMPAAGCLRAEPQASWT